jgi:hypothetical protein
MLREPDVDDLPSPSGSWNPSRHLKAPSACRGANVQKSLNGFGLEGVKKIVDSMESAMSGSEAFCVVILFVTMTIGFAIGSLLIKLIFYSSTHGFDDSNIELIDERSMTHWEGALQHAGPAMRP